MDGVQTEVLQRADVGRNKGGQYGRETDRAITANETSVEALSSALF